MEVECIQQVDEGGQDNDDYFYAYEIYKFTIDGQTLVARSYCTEPKEAHFLRIERNKKSLSLTTQDLESNLMHQAKEHLKNLGKTKLEWLNSKGDGYLRL
ncbi:hypothetical protein [Kiloniella majae]|uniref:hypothetical protein n=1 Tax=Kiloniella majae TaxID=1938558 RepID=UPI000A277E3F|nr:hypothetical protein [Kiloniella majae]